MKKGGEFTRGHLDFAPRPKPEKESAGRSNELNSLPFPSFPSSGVGTLGSAPCSSSSPFPPLLLIPPPTKSAPFPHALLCLVIGGLTAGDGRQQPRTPSAAAVPRRGAEIHPVRCSIGFIVCWSVSGRGQGSGIFSVGEAEASS